MNSEKKQIQSLREMEVEVEAEGREWMRKRLQEKMQEEAARHGGVFPPERTQGVASTSGDDAPAQRFRPGRTGGVARKKSR
jgi:hypothetical protein